MRKTTELCTKSLLSVAVLLCAFLFVGCEGPLSDEELGMSLLSGKSNSGLSLLDDEDDSGTSSQSKALVGTWLEFSKGSYWYIGGVIFQADGTCHWIDEAYNSDGNNYGDRNIPIGPITESGPTDVQLQILVSTIKAEPESDTWSASGNIITFTETWVDYYTNEVETDIYRIKYVLSGNTLMLYDEAEPDDDRLYDADGDGWEDEPEWILTKYNF